MVGREGWKGGRVERVEGGILCARFAVAQIGARIVSPETLAAAPQAS